MAAARWILEAEGRDALTMRRLGAEVGIRAPSLYKHFPDAVAGMQQLLARYPDIRRLIQFAAVDQGADLPTIV